MKLALALRAGRAVSPASTPSTASSAKKPRPELALPAGALPWRARVKYDILLLSFADEPGASAGCPGRPGSGSQPGTGRTRLSRRERALYLGWLSERVLVGHSPAANLDGMMVKGWQSPA